jgi:hypothetical protein
MLITWIVVLSGHGTEHRVGRDRTHCTARESDILDWTAVGFDETRDVIAGEEPK